MKAFVYNFEDLGCFHSTEAYVVLAEDRGQADQIMLKKESDLFTRKHTVEEFGAPGIVYDHIY